MILYGENKSQDKISFKVEIFEKRRKTIGIKQKKLNCNQTCLKIYGGSSWMGATS